MHAYSETYLNDAMEILGEAFDYAAVDCGLYLDDFFAWFISSGVAGAFETGSPKFVAGMSGVELVREVRFRVAGKREETPATQALERSVEYWVGWALAYYQWYRAIRFQDMATGGLTPSVVAARFVLHEADLSKFVTAADALLAAAAPTTSQLARIRQARGLTQKELADESDVALRMVQLYEQGQNDIRKASAETLLHLAWVLGCKPEDLV